MDNGTETPSETVVAPVTSNDATTTAKEAESNSQAAELQAQLEAARKEANQAKMRANQLENERAEENRKKQEEEGKWKDLYEAAQAREAEATRQAELEAVMSKYPEAARETAKKLFAAEDVDAQLALIQSVLDAKNEVTKPTDEETPQPKVEALNPNPRDLSSQESIISPEDDLKAMEDKLEKRLKGAGY